MTKNNDPKFTPGPWKFVRVQPEIDTFAIRTMNDDTLAAVGVSPVGWREGKDIANAALLAVAPEMYENESRNLEMLVFMRERYEDILRVITQDPDARAVVELANIGTAHLAKLVDIINHLSERIKQTEKLLAKARGEAK